VKYDYETWLLMITELSTKISFREENSLGLFLAKTL